MSDPIIRCERDPSLPFMRCKEPADTMFAGVVRCKTCGQTVSAQELDAMEMALAYQKPENEHE